MSGDIFDCHNLGGLERVVTRVCWVEARDAANPKKHKTIPHKEKIIWSSMSTVQKLTNPVLIQIVFIRLFVIVRLFVITFLIR